MPLDATLDALALLPVGAELDARIADVLAKRRPDLSPRASAANPLTIQKYALMPTEPPPIRVNQHGVTIDGERRMLAMLERGRETIKATVEFTATDLALFKLAIRANWHGDNLSEADN